MVRYQYIWCDLISHRLASDGSEPLVQITKYGVILWIQNYILAINDVGNNPIDQSPLLKNIYESSEILSRHHSLQITPMYYVTRPWPPFRVSSKIKSLGAPHTVTVIMPRKQWLGNGDKNALSANWFAWVYTRRAQLYRLYEIHGASGYRSTKW